MQSSNALWYPPTLRARWPKPLAAEWRAAYPMLFDDDDARLVRSQPAYHFVEWFAAIHLLQRSGALSLVQKYGYANHARKLEVIDALLGRRAAILHAFREHTGVQPPDLLVYLPDRSRFWFAEVKGPDDALSGAQVASHAFIEAQLGVAVEVLRVKEMPGRP